MASKTEVNFYMTAEGLKKDKKKKSEFEMLV